MAAIFIQIALWINSAISTIGDLIGIKDLDCFLYNSTYALADAVDTFIERFSNIP